MANLSANPLSLLGDEYVAAQRIEGRDDSQSTEPATEEPLPCSSEFSGIQRTIEDRTTSIGLTAHAPPYDGLNLPVAETKVMNKKTELLPQRDDTKLQQAILCESRHRAAFSTPVLSPGSLVPAAATQGSPRAEFLPPALAGIKCGSSCGGIGASLSPQSGVPTRGRGDVNYSSQSSPARIMARGRSLSTNRKQGVSLESL